MKGKVGMDETTAGGMVAQSLASVSSDKPRARILESPGHHGDQVQYSRQESFLHHTDTSLFRVKKANQIIRVLLTCLWMFDCLMCTEKRIKSQSSKDQCFLHPIYSDNLGYQDLLWEQTWCFLFKCKEADTKTSSSRMCRSPKTRKRPASPLK